MTLDYHSNLCLRIPLRVHQILRASAERRTAARQQSAAAVSEGIRTRVLGVKAGPLALGYMILGMYYGGEIPPDVAEEAQEALSKVGLWHLLPPSKDLPKVPTPEAPPPKRAKRKF